MKIIAAHTTFILVTPLDLIRIAIDAVECRRKPLTSNSSCVFKLNSSDDEFHIAVDPARFRKDQADKFELHTLTKLANREAWNT